MTSTRTSRTVPAPAALAADIACVLVFCALGRRSHAEGVTLTGVAETAWPFLTGTALGWLLAKGWQRPAALAPTGVVVWVCTVAVGMLLRKVDLFGPPKSTAASFIVVASLVTAVLVMGWRLLVTRVARGR